MSQRGSRTLLCFCFVIFLCSCNARHIGEIRRLQEASNDKKEQVAEIRAANKRFDLLLKAVADGTIVQSQTQEDFLQRFGAPIFVKRLLDSSEYSERWLYRYAEDFWKSKKVYIYFDRQGKIVTWEHQPSPIQKIAP